MKRIISLCPHVAFAAVLVALASYQSEANAGRHHRRRGGGCCGQVATCGSACGASNACGTSACGPVGCAANVSAAHSMEPTPDHNMAPGAPGMAPAPPAPTPALNAPAPAPSAPPPAPGASLAPRATQPRVAYYYNNNRIARATYQRSIFRR